MSFSEWKEVILGDYCTKIGSGITPRGGDNVYIDHGVSLIRSQNIYDFKFENKGLVFINLEQANKMKNVEVELDDILLNITGDSVARCCIVPQEVLPARVNQHVSIIRVKKEYINPKFLLYFINNSKTKELLLSLSSAGGTRKALTKNMIEKLKLKLPQIEEQKLIAATLACLDKKIEINNKINRNLEDLGCILIRHIFENSDRTIALKKLLDFYGGFAFKSSAYESEGIYKIVTIKNVQDGYIETNNCSYINVLPDKLKNEQKLSVGDVLLSLTGNVGRVGIVSESNLLLNQRVAKVRAQKGLIPFIYFLLREPSVRSNLESIARGTAQANLSPVEALTIEVKYSEKIAVSYNAVFSSLYEQIISNNQENQRLISIRDSLLPKLMSGELDVSDLDLYYDKYECNI